MDIPYWEKRVKLPEGWCLQSPNVSGDSLGHRAIGRAVTTSSRIWGWVWIDVTVISWAPDPCLQSPSCSTCCMWGPCEPEHWQEAWLSGITEFNTFISAQEVIWSCISQLVSVFQEVKRNSVHFVKCDWGIVHRYFVILKTNVMGRKLSLTRCEKLLLKSITQWGYLLFFLSLQSSIKYF